MGVIRVYEGPSATLSTISENFPVVSPKPMT